MEPAPTVCNTGNLSNLIDGVDSVSALWNAVLPKISQMIKSSGGLPASGDSYDYYASYPAFEEFMTVEGKRVYELAQRLFSHQGLRLQGSEGHHYGLEELHDDLVDANDTMIERISSMLDLAENPEKRKQEQDFITAEVSRQSLAVRETQKNQSTTTSSTGGSRGALPKPGAVKGSTYKLFTARYVQRPQLKFTEKVDNREQPFKPILKHKDNAMVDFVFKSSDTDHPYRYEINNFERTAKQMMEPDQPPTLPGPTDVAASVLFVDSLEPFLDVCSHLNDVSEIAVDLEHHNYRSYLGFTCLIQISTRDRDVVLDALSLRSELYRLNKYFTDPTKVKVFHGASSDIEWLQRDFGVYVVNMFDTYHASNALRTARHSLAYLLQLYCGIEADKQYQRADWRMRPLPEEMLKYASEDTRYLLYIYDRMRTDLLHKAPNRSLLNEVLSKSNTTTLQVYKKPVCSEEGMHSLYGASKKRFNSRQLHALQGLYRWRDRVGREEDESLAYILPSHMLLQLSEILPRETVGVLACCNPVPGSVRKYMSEIYDIIKSGRSQRITEGEEVRSRAQQQKSSTTVWCPHEPTVNPSSTKGGEKINQSREAKFKMDSTSLNDTVHVDSATGEEMTASVQPTTESVNVPSPLYSTPSKDSSVGVAYSKSSSFYFPSAERSTLTDEPAINLATKYFNLLQSFESPLNKYAPKKLSAVLKSGSNETASAGDSMTPKPQSTSGTKRPQISSQSTKRASSSQSTEEQPKQKKNSRSRQKGEVQSSKTEAEPSVSPQFEKPKESFQAYEYTKEDQDLFVQKASHKKRPSKGPPSANKEGDSKKKPGKPKNRTSQDSDHYRSMSFKR